MTNYDPTLDSGRQMRSTRRPRLLRSMFEPPLLLPAMARVHPVNFLAIGGVFFLIGFALGQTATIWLLALMR